MAFELAYRMSEAQTLRSVDSYYVLEATVVCFQVTQKVDHELSIEELIELLQDLNLLDEVVTGNRKLVLVFVVPKPGFF